MSRHPQCTAPTTRATWCALHSLVRLASNFGFGLADAPCLVLQMLSVGLAAKGSDLVALAALLAVVVYHWGGEKSAMNWMGAGHLHSVPPRQGLQVCLQAEHLPDPYRRLVHVAHRCAPCDTLRCLLHVAHRCVLRSPHDEHLSWCRAAPHAFCSC